MGIEAGAGADARYQRALDEGRFVIQRCRDCARHVFYPREICPHCGGARLDWAETGGSGTVHTTTVVRRKPEAGGDYGVVVVELDEGVRLMSRVEGVGPAAVTIGMRVKARVVKDKGRGLLVFDPAEQPA